MIRFARHKEHEHEHTCPALTRTPDVGVEGIINMGNAPNVWVAG
jgi:hypothetical protein